MMLSLQCNFRPTSVFFSLTLVSFLLFPTLPHAQPSSHCLLNSTHCSCFLQDFAECPLPAMNRNMCYGFPCSGYICVSSCDGGIDPTPDTPTALCEISKMRLLRFTAQQGSPDEIQPCTVFEGLVPQPMWVANPTPSPPSPVLSFPAETLVQDGHGFILENGDSTSSFYSQFVGDLNNDGYPDIAIITGDNQDIAVIFGTSDMSVFEPIYNFSSLDGTNGFLIRSTAETIGTRMTRGDINGDGVVDLIISEDFGDPDGFINAGIVHIVYGRSGLALNQPVFSLSDLNGTNGFRIEGTIAQQRIGVFLAVSDINNDGYDDIILGSITTLNATDQHEAFVVFGKANFQAILLLSALSQSEGFAIELDGLDPSTANAPTTVATIDVNGDNIADIIVGLETANQNYVIFGKYSFDAVVQVSSLNGINGYILQGSPGDRIGNRVFPLGDVNNDGVGDFATSSTPNGNVFVVFGSREARPREVFTSSLNGQNGFTASGSELGYSGTFGDINGDGVDDLIIGANYAATARGRTGRLYVIYGRTSDKTWMPFYNVEYMAPENGFAIDGEAPIEDKDELFSRTVSSMDFNGDGISDILASARGHIPVRRSYVFYGRRDWQTTR